MTLLHLTVVKHTTNAFRWLRSFSSFYVRQAKNFFRLLTRKNLLFLWTLESLFYRIHSQKIVFSLRSSKKLGIDCEWKIWKSLLNSRIKKELNSFLLSPMFTWRQRNDFRWNIRAFFSKCKAIFNFHNLHSKIK